MSNAMSEKNGIPAVACNGFGLEGAPCTGCPNDFTCPVLMPSTRLRLYLEAQDGTEGQRRVLEARARASEAETEATLREAYARQQACWDCGYSGEEWDKPHNYGGIEGIPCMDRKSRVRQELAA